MLNTILLVVQVVLAVSLIGLILFQRGKGAEAGAAFGAGASGTVFGAKGSGSFLTRTTAVLATLFIANSLALAHLARQVPEEPDSLAERAAQMQEEQASEEAAEPETPTPATDDLPDAGADGDAELPAMPEQDAGDADDTDDEAAEDDQGDGDGA